MSEPHDRTQSINVTSDPAETLDAAATSAFGPPHSGMGDPRSPPSIPGYAIEGELGRGGMGVVYKARHLDLNRVVAIKIVLSGGHAGPNELARFRTEAEAAARLQHPNIVQIHEIGEHDGRPFLSLEFCPGGSLEECLAATPMTPREAAALVRTLAEAMQAAHDARVIHRDLKPANVLLGADGAPKITDFGLAKQLDEQGRTQTGAIMGTPAYMAPEQAVGRKDVGPPADIYALGALLYETLTGRRPFVTGTVMETLHQVLEHAPVPPQVLNPAVPRDLQTICLKCLEKDPRRRYESATALADDLGRWLNGEWIHARSYNLLGRVAAAIDRGHYDVQFAGWGSMLLGFAVVIGLGHVAATAVLLVQSSEQSVATVTLIYLCMLAALLVLFWRNRPEGLMPRTTAERQLWSVLAGFVAACVLMGMTDRLMSSPQRPHEPLRMYPPFTVLSGLTFLVLGNSYWGACYLLAGGFWLLAVVLPLSLEFGPAGFGLMWSVALVTIGLRLRRLGGA